MIENIASVEYDSCGRMKYNPDLHDRQGQPWTNDEIEYLTNWYIKIGIEEMSLALGRTEGTVANKVYHLRKRGLMPMETSYRPERILKPKKRNTSKDPDRSIQGSIVKQSITLYHRNERMQIVS